MLNLYVDDLKVNRGYDMILGCDLLSELKNNYASPKIY